MATRKFYYWKIIFASFATACGNNPPAFNNVLAIVKNREHEIFDRGVNQFCDYMQFTGSDLLMYPCNMTEEMRMSHDSTYRLIANELEDWPTAQSVASLACDSLLHPADALDMSFANTEMDIQTRGPLVATACAGFSLITGPLSIILAPICLTVGLILPTP